MTDFSRQLSEAISKSRSGLQQVNSLATSPTVNIGMAGIASLSANGRRSEDAGREEPQCATSGGVQVGEYRMVPREQEQASEMYYTTARSPVIRSATPVRVGTLAGCWKNPWVAAAMPSLLVAERVRGNSGIDDITIRTQLFREVQHFQQTLLRQQFAPDDIRRVSYLLCTFIDGIGTELKEHGVAPLNLLIEFHRDSWGGEKCFDDLEYYMQEPGRHASLLGFYHLILSMGFKGKYHILDRGDVLLSDLFLRLNAALDEMNHLPPLNLIKNEVVTTSRYACISPFRLLSMGALICLLAYSGIAFHLHDKSRSIRSAIAAWEPPVPRKINIMETLPQPLPQILKEGWLEAKPDPRGWLLLFTSDGAFRTGKSVLSQEFIKKRNIERLGEALAGWPGDLEVIGHTDNLPFRYSKVKDPNFVLSEERAQKVAEKLREGTDINRKYQRDITAFGKGDSDPIADNSTDEGRRKNRRVDILWKVGERANAGAENDNQQRDEMPALLSSPSIAGKTR
ncbi:type IVB secretion system protein IcmH/DotU [Pantoea sp. y20]